MLGFIFGSLVKKLKRAASDVSDDFVKSAGQELNYFFDQKLDPLADKLDYIAQKRIEQSKVEIEELETKIKVDLEFLLNNADEKASKQIEHINQVRELAIADLRETIGQTDAYLENRINQISLVVMKALNLTEEITKTTLSEINNLEYQLFQDANQLVDKFIDGIDEVLEGKIEQIRNELKKNLAHPLPNPFDKCKQKLKIQWKFGSRISDIEIYELNECYELSKLNEKTAIDEVLKVYGQLQLNAARMAALARNAPELKKRAIEDWIEYGVLCEFWRNTIEDYASNEPLLLEADKPQNLMIGQSNEQNWINLSD